MDYALCAQHSVPESANSKEDFFCPTLKEWNDFSCLVCGLTTLCQTRVQCRMFQNPCPFIVKMANSTTYFLSQVNVNHPHTRPSSEALHFVPTLIQMSLKIPSCVANMAEDIDSLGLGCEWLFMESIDSAVQLGWTTLHAQNVLLLLLSSENQRGSFSHWKSIQITVEVLVLPCRAGKRKRKNDCFHHQGVLPHASLRTEAWGILWRDGTIGDVIISFQSQCSQNVPGVTEHHIVCQ